MKRTLAFVFSAILSITVLGVVPVSAQEITQLGGQVQPSYSQAGSAIIGAQCELSSSGTTPSDPIEICINGAYCAADSSITTPGIGSCRATTSSVGLQCMPNTSDCGSGTVCEANSSGEYVCTVTGNNFESEYTGQSGSSGVSPSPALSGTSGTGGSGSTAAPSSGGINTTYIAGYSNSLRNIINSYLVPVLIAVAFIVFLYGVYKYFIAGAAKPEERKKGTSFVLYGIIGLVIIFSVWGLVSILGNTIGVEPGGGPPASGYPTL